VVGRFLEHSRIYFFKNQENPEYYIGSADAMKRNLENRVEVLVPVEDPDLQGGLRVILDTLLSDSHGAWQMNADGSYVLMEGKDPTVASSQQALIQQAAARLREATRLKRRKPQGARRRNIRH
jgi:polyphosphate kinase